MESLTPELFMEKSAEVLDALKNENTRAKIPLISNWENFNRLKDMQLVRFRGLVQNMLDPEIYLETYQTKGDNDTLSMRKGKFRDNLKLEVIVRLSSVADAFETDFTKLIFICREMKRYYSSHRKTFTQKDVQSSWCLYPV